MEIGKSLLGKLILVAVLLIFGSVLVGVIASQTYSKTISTAVSNELATLKAGATAHVNDTYTYSVANAASTVGGDCPITNFVLTNSSGTVMTVTTDYVPSLTTGTYKMVDSATAKTAGFNITTPTGLVSYNYCGTGYTSGWGGTILNMIGGFLALMLFAAAVVVMYSIYKDVTG